MDQQIYLNFLHKLEKMKCNTRHSWTTSGRHESVAEHSWRLSVMALLLKYDFPELDMEKVLRMCLIHDFGEAVTGDIPSFLKTKTDEKTEDRAVETLLHDLPDPIRSDLLELFEEMNQLETPEAILYKSLDKMEAIVSHNEAGVSTWLPLEHELNMTYGNEETSRLPYMTKLRALLRADSINQTAKSGIFKDQVYDLYSECYSDALSKQDFFAKLNFDNSELLPKINGDQLAAFALVQGNEIQLLCVRPEHRRKGFGRQVLHMAELYIHEQGYSEVLLGSLNFSHKTDLVGYQLAVDSFMKKHNYSIPFR